MHDTSVSTGLDSKYCTPLNFPALYCLTAIITFHSVGVFSKNITSKFRMIKKGSIVKNKGMRKKCSIYCRKKALKAVTTQLNYTAGMMRKKARMMRKKARMMRKKARMKILFQMN